MAIYLDDQVMNGKKAVLEYLKLDAQTIPSARRKELEVLGGKRDADGNLRISKSIYGVAEYTVYVPLLGREVKVRLAKTQRPHKDKGFEYTPKNIGIEPSEDGSVLITDELEFLFWFLRPMCSQSPFKPKFGKSFYEYKDNDVKAVAEARLEEARIDAMSLIYGENRKSEKELKEIAKGLNISGVEDMSKAVIQSELKKRAQADPVGFYSQATSREIIFSGKIQEAIDRDILKVKNINGMKRWYLQEEEILPLQFGEDDVKALKDFLSANWYLFAEKVQNSLDNKSILSNLSSPENDTHFEEHKTPVMKAELSASFNDALKEMEKDPYLKEKVVKWADLDPEDNSVHFKTRESMSKHQVYIDAYKESLKGI